MASAGPDPFDLAAAALARAPAGLLVDLDGTLAPIVADPASVRPVPGAVDALAILARRLAVVGIVSGRAGPEVRRILGPAAAGLLVVGNHGIEWLEPGAAEALRTPGLAAAESAIGDALDSLRGRLPDGVRIEEKRFSATLHYRAAADRGAAERFLLAALEPLAGERLELRRGRLAMELRPRGLGDKGTAVRAVVVRHGLRGLVVAGDDVTDLDMFAAATALRHEQGLVAAVIAVHAGREVPPAVRAAADAEVASPEAMGELLSRLAAGADQRRG